MDMMMWANVTEEELRIKKEISTEFGETLSWEYLCYVREHPIVWNVPTCILYGEKDNLTSIETISEFAERIGASLTVMKDGEHWFHTEEQMEFLDDWIRNIKEIKSGLNISPSNPITSPNQIQLYLFSSFIRRFSASFIAILPTHSGFTVL